MTVLILNHEETIDGHTVAVHRVSELPEMHAVHIWDEETQMFVALVDNAPTRSIAIETARAVLKDPRAFARCFLAEAVRYARVIREARKEERNA